MQFLHRLPYSYGFVHSSRSNTFTIRRPGQCSYIVCMLSIDKEQFSGEWQPELHYMVIACRGDDRTVRRPGYGSYLSGMACICENVLACYCIPDAHNFVITCSYIFVIW